MPYQSAQAAILTASLDEDGSSEFELPVPADLAGQGSQAVTWDASLHSPADGLDGEPPLQPPSTPGLCEAAAHLACVAGDDSYTVMSTRLGYGESRSITDPALWSDSGLLQAEPATSIHRLQQVLSCLE